MRIARRIYRKRVTIPVRQNGGSSGLQNQKHERSEGVEVELLQPQYTLAGAGCPSQLTHEEAAAATRPG